MINLIDLIYRELSTAERIFIGFLIGSLIMVVFFAIINHFKIDLFVPIRIFEKKRGKRRDAQRVAALRAIEQIEIGCLDNPYETGRQLSKDRDLHGKIFISTDDKKGENHMKTEWISVDESTPAIGRMVLVATSYGALDVCRFSFSESGDRPIWTNAMRPQHTNGSVTHWATLPALPDGKKIQ